MVGFSDGQHSQLEASAMSDLPNYGDQFFRIDLPIECRQLKISLLRLAVIQAVVITDSKTGNSYSVVLSGCFGLGHRRPACCRLVR